MFKPTQTQVIQALSAMGGRSFLNQINQFTADQVRASLVRSTGHPVCGATVVLHLKTAALPGDVQGYYRAVGA